MPEMNFENDVDLSTALAGFNHATTRAGEKMHFEKISAFYLGGGVAEHFPYLRDKAGKKIIDEEKTKPNAKFTTYKREEKSDGYQVTLQTAGKDKLYVVFHTKEAPTFEIGSLYYVEGDGYGENGVPTFLDANCKATKIGHLQGVTPEVVAEG